MGDQEVKVENEEFVKLLKQPNDPEAIKLITDKIFEDTVELKEFPLKLEVAEIASAVSPEKVQKNKSEIVDSVLGSIEKQIDENPELALECMSLGLQKIADFLRIDKVSVGNLFERISKTREIARKVAKKTGAYEFTLEVICTLTPGMSFAFHFKI